MLGTYVFDQHRCFEEGTREICSDDSSEKPIDSEKTLKGLLVCIL